MLQEPVEDAEDANVVGQTRNSGRRQQLPRTSRSILAPARDAAYSARTTSGSTNALTLAVMRPTPPLAAFSASRAMSESTFNCRSRGDTAKRCHSWTARVARQEIEQRGRVLAELLGGGEQPEVGVHLGRRRVVVARPQMDIAAQFGPFTAHDKRHFAVRFEFDESVDNMHSGPLELPRPVHVRLLVESGEQLDDGRDVLPFFGRADERPDDGALATGAVQRLLDGEDIGVFCRLPEEVDHATERLVGMVHEHVAHAAQFGRCRPRPPGRTDVAS